MFLEIEKRILIIYNLMFDKFLVFLFKKKGDLYEENIYCNVFIIRCLKKYKKVLWSNYNGIKILFFFVNVFYFL